ncbi:hypothetical protein Nepgr_012227 [Nepenthes gracilis]|uniref:Uncharacterized protein n=1 Tax=Nepenthes gracilis TaxID=150966 RepID=A0AAD3SGK9_NEPGR|nr:hypothetical protein Nepgr_012227 [Nepenthes gracilis]
MLSASVTSSATDGCIVAVSTMIGWNVDTRCFRAWLQLMETGAALRSSCYLRFGKLFQLLSEVGAVKDKIRLQSLNGKWGSDFVDRDCGFLSDPSWKSVLLAN